MINYAEKIANFNLIVGNQNEDIAYTYLSKTGWDENKAANLFTEENKKLDKALSIYMKNKERKQKMRPKQINNYPEYKIDSINSIFNSISKLFKQDNSQFFHRYFSSIKNAIKLLDNFISKLEKSSKIGIIMLYSFDKLKLLRDQIKNIINEPLSRELFLDSSLTYPVVDVSIEGSNFISELECTKLPLFIICKYKNKDSLAIIGKLEIPFKLGDFRDKIIEAELSYIKKPTKTNKENLNNNNNINNNNINNNNNVNNNNNNNKNKEYEPNYADYDFGDDEENMNYDFLNDFKDYNNMKLSDGQILAYQELKLRELEKMEEQKNIEKEKIIEEKKESNKIKENLKQEPDDDNPDKCIILFRFPDGEKSVQRKFLKQDKIKVLYDFIKSLGRDIFMEEDHHHFSLLQTFPYKLFDEIQNNTLEQEGLFPNSVLQIKEID